MCYPVIWTKKRRGRPKKASPDVITISENIFKEWGKIVAPIFQFGHVEESHAKYKNIF
jgi:hypothetical protein